MIHFAIQRTSRSKFSWEEQFIREKNESWDLFKTILPETKKTPTNNKKKEILAWIVTLAYWRKKIATKIIYSRKQREIDFN